MRWSRALAAFRRAEAEMREFGRRSGGAGRTFEEQCALDDRFNDHVVLVCRALRRLMRVPAPDLDALAVKVALVVDQDVAGLSGGERCLAVLKADAARLAMASRNRA